MVDSSLAVFSPGSSHPASVLYDALDHFDQKSPKADEAIRSIRPDLANAVDTCIEAAGRELDTYWQKRLLALCDVAKTSGGSIRSSIHGSLQPKRIRRYGSNPKSLEFDPIFRNRYPNDI
jgi:hypothetical protein